MSNNQLNDLSKTYLEAVYGGAKKEEPKDNRMVLTHADKKANTPAWQNRDKKNPKTGKPIYKRADHLKDDYEFARHKASVISRGGRLEDAVESWNQKLAYREAMKNVSEKKEVNVKDTYKTVAAIVDYDRSKKGSEDATWDSEHGKKKAAKKEKDYAAWERSKMKKDDPNWKHKKYHTGMHGEEFEVDESVGSAVDKALGAVGDTAKVAGKAAVGGVKVASKVVKGTANAAGRVAGTVVGAAKAAKKGFKSGADTNEEKRWQDDDGDGKWYEKSDVDGKISKREKKAKKHDCASKVKHEQFGIGNPVKGMHDLDENGKVAHYDVFFEHGIEKNVPVSSLEILEGHMHEHVIHEADIGDILARLEKKRISKGGDPEESPLPAMRKYHADKKKKVKKESLSDWRDDLSSLIEIVAEPEEEAEKKVKEGKVNNKVVINPKISEAIEEIGGEVLEHHSVDCDDDCEPNCEHDVAENRLVKKLTRPIRKAKRIAKRVRDSFDDDPGRAHTIGTLGNPSVKNEGKRKKAVKEGYGSKSSNAPKGSKVGSQSGKGLDAPKGSKVRKEIKALSTAAKTLKGSNVAKADKIEEGIGKKNCGCGQDPCVTYGKKADAKESLEFFRRFRGIDEAKRDLGDRLHRKRKLYDRTVKKAMDFARREGEAAGHARYRMGQLDTEMDKVKDKMKKEK